ncbi:MAG: hypothetical protein K2J93_05265 [Anaeroplasmataceae bacterium]|nr:hypothetical protein [Anaeroplasmataceae bacterium]
MRVPHHDDASYVLQYIMHALELREIIYINDIVKRFDYDKSSVYKLLKKIGINFATIDDRYIVKRIGKGMFQLKENSAEEEAELMEK